MTKIKDVYQEYLKRIENTSIEKSSFDILFENFLGFKNHVEVELHAFDEIEDYTLLNEQFNRLLSGEPVQYIIKKGHFYGNDFYVDNRVLIPRNETEELIDLVIRTTSNLSNPVVYDICTGSGCLGITYKLHKEDALVYLSDMSKDALDVANKNANDLHADVKFIESDLLNNFKNTKKANVIICNPPYISYGENIDDIVWNNEPHLALIPPSGDGLEMYRKLFKTLSKHVQDMAYLFFEIGSTQKQGLTKLIKEYLPNSKYCFHIDINGKDRILEIRYSK